MDEVRVTIIGAGVVGLSVAAALAREHDGVVVLERHKDYGRETSSRNSEVIHSGIYYPPGSLKARLCVEGASLLYRYCEGHHVPFKRLGKLVVAVDQDEGVALEALYRRGVENGAQGLELLDGRGACALEPAVRAHSALYSLNTGILDSHALMTALFRESESLGAMFSFGGETAGIERVPGGYVVRIEPDGYSFFTRVLVNAAGLGAERVAALAGIDVDEAGYTLAPCKGSYFQYAKRSPVGRLVYPVPHADLKGLGIHATLDMADRLRFGPDAEYVDAPDFTVDPSKRAKFFEGASRIIAGLDESAFMPDMAGVRPKLKPKPDNGGVRDFVIAEESGRGLPGLVSLVGIESPGLTACLSIAELVRGMVREMF